MKITHKELKKIATNLLSIINKEKIDHVDSLEEKLRSSIMINIDMGDGEYVSISKRPSNEAFAYTFSYITPNSGIPMEIRINPTLNYTKVIIKDERLVDGYQKFAIDPFGNKVQYLTIKSSDLPFLKIELERLSAYESTTIT